MDINTLKICYALKKYYDNYRFYIIYYGIIKNISIDVLARKLNEKKETIIEIEQEGLKRIKSLSEDDFVGYDTCTRFNPMNLNEICHCYYARHYFVDMNNSPIDYYIFYQSLFNKINNAELLSELLGIPYDKILRMKFRIGFNYERKVGHMFNNIVDGVKERLLKKYNVSEIMNFDLEPSYSFITDNLELNKEKDIS
jgi:hypothetical protein